jgi:hypothetical protein
VPGTLGTQEQIDREDLAQQGPRLARAQLERHGGNWIEVRFLPEALQGA